MAKSKKSVKKSAVKKTVDQVEARPIGEGKDPLAEGNTLHNPTNSEAETHYEVKETSKEASKIKGQDANERAEQHNAEAVVANAGDDAPKPDLEEQEEIAAKRAESDAPDEDATDESDEASADDDSEQSDKASDEDSANKPSEEL